MKEALQSLQNLKDCLQVYQVAQEMIPELQGQFRGAVDQPRDQERNLASSINSNEAQGLIGERSVNIQYVAGVINQEDIDRLKRLIFRSTKGKSYVFMRDYIEPEVEGAITQRKSVYIIVFWDGHHIREKIQKICDSFSGNRYELPELSSIPGKIQEIKNSIENAKNVYDSTRRLLRDLLINFDKISDNDDGQQ